MCFRPPSAMKTNKCPACGTMNVATAKICSKCGGKLTTFKPDK